MKLNKWTLLVCLQLASFALLVDAHPDEITKDVLFLALKYAPDAASARTYEDEIWQQWFQSGDQAIDQLMQKAMQQRRNYDFAGAVETLNRMIELRPGYAEAWNQRATMYFFQENYEASLQDVAKTLELEPRHFGALAGRAVIRMKQLKPALARQNIIEAAKINPYLKELDFFPGLKAKKTNGVRLD